MVSSVACASSFCLFVAGRAGKPERAGRASKQASKPRHYGGARRSLSLSLSAPLTTFGCVSLVRFAIGAGRRPRERYLRETPTCRLPTEGRTNGDGNGSLYSPARGRENVPRAIVVVASLVTRPSRSDA